MHGATYFQSHRFGIGRRQYISLKGLAITQRSYSMSENRPGLSYIYRREGIVRKLEEDAARGVDRENPICETCRDAFQLGKTRF